jgi:hypothetical protein
MQIDPRAGANSNAVDASANPPEPKTARRAGKWRDVRFWRRAVQ